MVEKLFKSNTCKRLLSASEIINKTQDHYETLVYPYRDPEEEKHRFLDTSPSNLMEVQHYIFGGKRDFDKPFRALIAGGGTGDAAIALAQRLQDQGDHHEVIHLDLSVPTQKVAAARAKIRGLNNIKFIQGSLLECDKMGIGEFDYIDSCGVLHHLPDTAEGFKTLYKVLKPDGGMGIMLYGTLGRTGVYYVQETMKFLTSEQDTVTDKAKLTQRLLKQLPDTNWMHLNKVIHWKGREDNEIYDLFCHICDRSFKVDEICDMMHEVGFKISSFMLPAVYDPLLYISDPILVEKINALSQEQKWLLAELLSGNKSKHIFYIVKQDNPMKLPHLEDENVIPMTKPGIRKLQITSNKPMQSINANISGLNLQISLPPLSSSIIPALDNKRIIKEIYQHIHQNTDTKIDHANLKRDFHKLAKSLISVGQMTLSTTPINVIDYE